MAAKGTIAKENVVNKIREAFGSDFIREYDKKIYVWGQENGERIQIAIAMTCPKVQIETGAPVAHNFEEPARAEITEEEKKNIADLMARLGL